jgi:hypothetical protein
MKNLLNRKKASLRALLRALVLGFAWGFTACGDDIHDFSKTTPADEAVSIYIADSVFTYSVDWTLDEKEYTASMDTVIVKFPVYLTEAVENDVEVTVTLDNQLCNAYNTVHDVAYKTVTVSDVILRNTTVTIPAGKTQSDSLVTVVYNRPVKSFVDTTGFMIPVRINTYKGGGVKPDYEHRHSYVFINTSRVNAVWFETKSTEKTYVAGMGINTGSGFIPFNDMQFDLSARWAARENVTLTVNNDSIAAYNAKNGTNYQPMPAGLAQSYTISMAGGAVAGNVYRKPFSLNYTGELSALNDTRGYLIPLQITNVDGNNITNYADRSIFYVCVKYAEYFLELVNSAPGAVQPKTGYIASGKNANTNASVTINNGILFDNNKTNLFAAWTHPVNIVLDLGAEVENITGVGIFMMPNNVSVGYCLGSVEVGFATEDMYANGKQTSMGTVSTTARVAASYIKPNKPFTARYIYFTRMTGQLGLILSELEVYK